MCHVHLPRARPARQPPSLHHREAGLCQLGSDVQHPFLPAGLESTTVTEKQHGNHSLSPIAEDVTLTRAFKDLQLPQTDHWLIPVAVPSFTCWIEWERLGFKENWCLNLFFCTFIVSLGTKGIPVVCMHPYFSSSLSITGSSFLCGV